MVLCCFRCSFLDWIFSYLASLRSNDNVGTVWGSRGGSFFYFPCLLFVLLVVRPASDNGEICFRLVPFPHCSIGLPISIRRWHLSINRFYAVRAVLVIATLLFSFRSLMQVHLIAFIFFIISKWTFCSGGTNFNMSSIRSPDFANPCPMFLTCS